jgi:hypothetical protein
MRYSDRPGVGDPLEHVRAFHLREQRQHHHGQLRHRTVRVGRVNLDRVGQVAHAHSPTGHVVDHARVSTAKQDA